MSNPIFHSQYTAAQIEAAIGKGPRVNSSGYWEVWNVANMAYESTGVGAGVTPPTVVTQVSQMTNHGYIYIYNGSETGYTAGYWYYWDGSAWTAGGAYQVAATDPTLSVAGAAADAKATGAVRTLLYDTWLSEFATPKSNNYIHNASLWTVGQGVNTNGANMVNTKYCRTAYSGLSAPMYVCMDSNVTTAYEIFAYEYSSTSVSSALFAPRKGYSDEPILLTLKQGAKYFRIGAKRKDNADITSADVTVLASAIKVFRFTDVDLKIANAPADAKVTGETINRLSKEVVGKDVTVGNELDGYIDNSGVFHENSSWKSLLIDANRVIIDDSIKLLTGSLNSYSSSGINISAVAFFDNEMSFLGAYSATSYSTPARFTIIPDNTSYIAFNSTTGDFVIEFNSFYVEYRKYADETSYLFKRTIEINGYNDGTSVYETIFIRRGDDLYIDSRSTGAAPDIYYSNGNHTTGSYAEPISQVRQHITADKSWAGFTIKPSSDDPTNTWNVIITISSKIPSTECKNTIYVAASDSTYDNKRIADVLCDGVDDQTDINHAIRLAKAMGASYVELCPGNYYIDHYTQANIYGVIRKVGIVFHHVYDTNAVTLRGPGDREKRGKVRLYVRNSFFEGVEQGEEISVISGGPVNTGYQGGQGFGLENIRVALEDMNHPCIIVNYQWSYWGTVNNCTISATGYGADHVPVQGLVGVRGWLGWSDGTDIGLDNVIVMGCYVGFQLGGEHAVLTQCLARYNYYGYTFGEYQTEPGSGSQIHPITLINCCDEHMAALPKFCKSGDATTPADGRCAVDMISFNVEYYPLISGTNINGATEDTDGGWVGRIDYTIDKGQIQNKVNIAFWADGHGKNFRTTNSAQKEIGTTALRLTYAPNYMQIYYDEDIGKVLYCVDPATKKWIDANGTDVDA